jgi:alanine-glyoxylate transaminase/serine-glyoxylate transaminase/serine-pyruvate transaminase
MEVTVDQPLLMIPGPIEISDTVFAATCQRPGSHLAPGFKAAFARALRAMRTVWAADEAHQPFVMSGSGTLAMEAVATNLVDPGDPVLVVNTGYFGDRMAEMLRRRGAEVYQVGAGVGRVPDRADVNEALAQHSPKVMFVTHVDTSTGVRTDAESLAGLARAHGVLSVFDGVCATAAERFEQAKWGADVVLTASQKAIGLPAGLALWVASPRAMAARGGLQTPPPMSLDWQQWLPVLHAYEAEENAYFSTPATTLIPALDVGLGELLAEGMDAVFTRHERAADRLRAAWAALELRPVAEAPANTLSALYWPDGVDASALGRIKENGAIVAGGLHPEIKAKYFRVGHMGEVTRSDDHLRQTVRAVALGVGLDPTPALEAFGR